MAAYNKFVSMPFIPYRIMEYLAYNNENIWKILRYDTYDCLSKSNLTFDEKMDLIWKNQGNQQDYRVFLTWLVENMIPDSITLLKLFRYNTMPQNNLEAYATYEFNLLYGGKIALIDYQGVPCSRGDVLEAEILQTLNGKDVGGVGMLQFNRQVSSVSHSQLNIGNNETFEGISLWMGIYINEVGADAYGCQ